MRHILKDIRLYIVIGSIGLLGVLVLIVADTWVMPAYTNYGEGITVPDVKNLSMEQAVAQFTSIGLRYEVYDERPNEVLPPGHVMDQNPLGGTIVKPNRKIYLMISAETRPTVSMPPLMGNSLDNARIQLQVRGLQLGSITYESSPYRNSVLRQSVAPGESIRRNTVIHLVIGDGIGQRRIATPNLIGLRLTQAQLRIRDSALRVGEITFEASSVFEPNHVLRFTPAGTDSLFEGMTINLVVTEKPNVQEAIEGGVVLNDSIPRF